MQKDDKRRMFTSDVLRGIPGIVHGFSTRHHGDMRKEQNRELFCKTIKAGTRVRMLKQVHGNRILRNPDSSDGIQEADGMFLSRLSAESSQSIAVLTADCAPVLLADSSGSHIAAVHAGWKGTISGIVKEAIHAFTAEGVKPDQIFAAIGPSIHSCCYRVDEDRARLFIEMFSRDSGVCVKSDGGWYIDIATGIRLQLTAVGVASQHISVATECTSCKIDELYSYRKDDAQSFGEQIAVIGFGKSYE